MHLTIVNIVFMRCVYICSLVAAACHDHDYRRMTNKRKQQKYDSVLVHDSVSALFTSSAFILPSLIPSESFSISKTIGNGECAPPKANKKATRNRPSPRRSFVDTMSVRAEQICAQNFFSSRSFFFYSIFCSSHFVIAAPNRFASVSHPKVKPTNDESSKMMNRR